MNNTTIYQQLQHHYQKLQTRLAKARNKGKSISFQERLLGRIQRCALQMKQLGAGVAVMAALGVATPVLGQVDTLPLNYVECTGGDNPFDTIPNTSYPNELRSISFVDLDGDGDQDMLINNAEYSYATYTYSTKLFYRENTGSPTNPVYGPEVVNSVFNSVDVTNLIQDFTFADVDGDGDQDMFASIYVAANSNAILDYYENTGNTTSATFVQRTGTDNPLQGAVNYINGLPLPNTTAIIYPSFVDLDGDNDLDCFVTTNLIGGYLWPSNNNDDRVLFYLNTPTGFVQQTPSNNPLNIVNADIPTNAYLIGDLKFADLDRQQDGNLDVIFFTSGATLGSSGQFLHYKNIGTSTSPAFSSTNNNVMDSVFVKYNVPMSNYNFREVIDLTNSGRVQVVAFGSTDLRYFKDTSNYTSLLKLPVAQSLAIYPNPSMGVIQLEKSLTGQMNVYNTLGQVIYSKELEGTQILNLTAINSGVYIIHIRTKEEEFVQKINIVKS